MKTSTPEVLCDGCGLVIAVGSPSALFITVRGITVKHEKGDFCGWACVVDWANFRRAGWNRAASGNQEQP